MNVPIHAPFTLADAIAEHREKIAAITLECSHWQKEMQAHLLTAAPASVMQSLATAQADANEAAQAHAAAAERLRGHDGNKPASLGSVGEWARARGILSDELLAYSAILEERQHAAAAAADAVYLARQAAWSALKAEVSQANDVFFDAATMGISFQLLEVERAKGRQGQAFHKRLLMQNAIETLRPNPAQKAGKQ